jgi:chemotaxis protein methyltransferase CheR
MIVTVVFADVESFRSLVSQRLGLKIEDSKLDVLAEILRQRMEEMQCARFSEYERMFSSPKETRAVAERLTVCETYFFRYAEHFRAFTEIVLPDRVRRQEYRRQLRILSAGCASGEEAYSLAILIRAGLPDIASWEITIQGIDVNALMVKKAMRARYPAWSLRDTPAELKARYFRSEGREWLLDNSVKCMVTFEERNLVDEDRLFWQQETFDAIFCRNVTMYFTPEAAASVINRIAQSLVRGGFLFLGHAETLRGISQEFHLRHTHETFYYQRREAHEMLDSAELSIDPTGNYSGGNGVSPMAFPTLLKRDDTWFEVIRRASERITTLTDGRSSATPASREKVHHELSGPASSRPAIAWDRALAIELLREERFAEAIELLRGLPPGPRADPDVQLLLAVLLTNRGDLTEAEQVCLNVLHLDELNAGAHYLMALCREHAGDWDKAMQHDQTAVYLDSSFAMPHLHLGLIAKRSADMEGATRQLGQALTLLVREDPSRILLFGGGFTREALSEFCRAELRSFGGGA